ncbi:MAG: hypothetical protein PHX44_01670 [Sulfurimonas sp.]|uniref:hypothetical protein n=1 Tax=Sulfurimonas sp. TaxID=2022749 RepID=UPI00261D0B4C|nr:hypothetical protein [Sulfurimonas sp.]MDD2651726.1 hypothetical protein [Sulfurimonas sp.]MDD2651743.1 hypothetical protein [Sulfurimonas sp.]MDD3451705.1 hypothetical protein [Sulfurimonas sp.]MDD3451722.1 hypothetical protein [Sulfurimonas sp.]
MISTLFCCESFLLDYLSIYQPEHEDQLYPKGMTFGNSYVQLFFIGNFPGFDPIVHQLEVFVEIPFRVLSSDVTSFWKLPNSLQVLGYSYYRDSENHPFYADYVFTRCDIDEFISLLRLLFDSYNGHLGKIYCVSDETFYDVSCSLTFDMFMSYVYPKLTFLSTPDA